MTLEVCVICSASLLSVRPRSHNTFRESSPSNRISLSWFACACIVLLVKFWHHDLYNTLPASGSWLDFFLFYRQRRLCQPTLPNPKEHPFGVTFWTSSNNIFLRSAFAKRFIFRAISANCLSHSRFQLFFHVPLSHDSRYNPTVLANFTFKRTSFIAISVTWTLHSCVAVFVVTGAT